MISRSDSDQSIPGITGVNREEEDAYLSNYGAHKIGITQAEVAEYYNKWSQRGTYEDHLGPSTYRGPLLAAQKLSELFSPEKRPFVRVLDVAAGTGLVGQQLSVHGFRHIDALDPAESMLEVAKKKKIYENHIQEFINDQRTSIAPNVYDATLTSGGMGEGHIPCTGLDEMHRVTKPGGFVVIVMREEYLEYVPEYKDRLDAKVEDMRRTGRWQSVERHVVEKYSFGKNGVVFTLKKSS